MYCNNCGRKIPSDSNVCPYCGQKQIHVQLNSNKYKIPSSQHNSHKSTESVTSRISKKAKILATCLIAGALIGGGAIYHHIRQSSPQDINLSKQLNGHEYTGGSFANGIYYLNSDKPITGSMRKELSNTYLRFHKHQMIFIDKGHNSSESDALYQIKGHTLELLDNSSNKDILNFKLLRVSNNGKTLKFRASTARPLVKTHKIAHHNITIKQVK